jgi:hypothetical protein
MSFSVARILCSNVYPSPEAKPMSARKMLEQGCSVSDILDELQRQKEEGPWFPASNGTETWFTSRSGRRLLYCYQPSTGKHAYLSESDIILTDEEAAACMGLD